MAKEWTPPKAAPKDQRFEGRKGSRWINREPTGEELADWFSSVRLHEGLKHEHYVDGIVLIPQVETPQVIKQDAAIVKGPAQLVYTPYPKVETREVYFYDLCEVRGWVGRLDPVPVPRLEQEGYFNGNLPPGFFRQPIKKADGKIVPLLGCSYRCSMVEAGARYSGGEREVRRPAQGTKVVEMLNRWGDVDLNAFMKAETGAIGRALGAAGMLVIPGSGIATAEDMADIGNVAGTSGEAPAALPEDPPEDLAAHAESVREQLAATPEKYEPVKQWVRERYEIDLENREDLRGLGDGPLRGIVRRMEREL